MKHLFVIIIAFLAISLTTGCGDDTAIPFVFDAGTKDATLADSGNGGLPADASPAVARDVMTADRGQATDVDADDSTAGAMPE
jgi:hypothetical protein